MNQLGQRRIPLSHENTLNKFERENLFHDAEKLYSSGDKANAVSLFMSCLQSLDTHSVFSSLPACLRALSSHYLEQEDYIKSIHFIQAERMYYESALIDAAVLQQQLIDLAYHHKIPENKFILKDNFREIEMQKYETRIFEYERMTRYFMNHNKFGMALELARKTAKLNHKLYGSNNNFTKESLCKIRDIEGKIRRGKENLVTGRESDCKKNNLEYSSLQREGNVGTFKPYVSPSLDPKCKWTRHQMNIAIYTFKEILQLIATWTGLLAFVVVVLMFLYSLLVILHNYLLHSLTFIEILQLFTSLAHFFINMFDLLVKYLPKTFNNLSNLALEYIY